MQQPPVLSIHLLNILWPPILLVVNWETTSLQTQKVILLCPLGSAYVIAKENITENRKKTPTHPGMHADRQTVAAIENYFSETTPVTKTDNNTRMSELFPFIRGSPYKTNV